MTFDGRSFDTTMGSDVDRAGMFLELEDIAGGARHVRAEWFYSDKDGSMQFTAYVSDLPVAALEWFRCQSEERLPPSKHLLEREDES